MLTQYDLKHCIALGVDAIAPPKLVPAYKMKRTLPGVRFSYGTQQICLTTDQPPFNDPEQRFFMAVSHPSAKFYELKEREGLALLVYNLLYLMEIMYFEVAFQKKQKEENFSFKDAWNKVLEDETPYWVDIDEIKRPSRWLISFTKDYSLEFIRNELWIFFDAVRFYDGPLNARITPQDTHNMWQVLTCITEAAYIVTSMRYKDLNGESNEPIGSSGYVSPKQTGK